MSNISLENRIHDALPEKGETSSQTEQNDLAFTGAVTSFGNYQDAGQQDGHSSGQHGSQDGGTDHGSENDSLSVAMPDAALAMEVLGFPVSPMGRHVFAMQSSLQNEADLINEISANEDESTGFAAPTATGATFHYPVIAKQLGPDSIKPPKKP